MVFSARSTQLRFDSDAASLFFWRLKGEIFLPELLEYH